MVDVTLLQTPLRLSYGTRAGVRTIRQCDAYVDTIHNQLVGYADYANTTGGYGFQKYYVYREERDSSIIGTFDWAFNQCKALGGIIYFDPRGYFNIVTSADIRFSNPNVTVTAPGRNVTFWFDSLNSGVVVASTNIIFDQIVFRTLPGALTGDVSTPCTITSATAVTVTTLSAHGFVNGDTVRFGTTGNLPVPLLGAAAKYYVINTTQNTLQLSLTSGGAPINTSGATQSGQQYIFPWSKGGEHKLVTVMPQYADKIAFNRCEFRHASDGACDWSYSGINANTTPCRGTIQNCIFWDTDQAMYVGGLAGTSLNDPAIVQITVYNTIYAYCGERQPKISGFTTVDMVDVYYLTLPFRRDNLDPIYEYSICYGVETGMGGRATVRGCLFTAATGSGYVATSTYDSTGAISVVDCASENGMTFATQNISSVTSIPYILNHTPVPVPGVDRETWISNKWKTCGARPDAAPDGLFKWTSDTTAYPNGDNVLVDRALGGRWIRVDTPTEFPAYNDPKSGTYVPAYSNPVNGSSASSVGTITWTRTGNIISVSGFFKYAAAAIGDCSFQMTIPVASNLTSSYDISGTAICTANGVMSGGAITANVTNDTSYITLYATATGSRTYSFQFSYIEK